MAPHPLKGRIAIDVDSDYEAGWPGGLGKLASVRLDGHPVTVALFDPHEKRADGSWWVTPETLEEWAALGRVPGMRFVTHWLDGQPAEDVARAASDAVTRLDGPSAAHPQGARRVAACEWDVEMQGGTHDKEWQRRFLLGSVKVTNQQTTRLKGIRGAGGDLPNPTQPSTLGYRPGRPCVWSMEGRQDFNTSAAAEAATAGALIGPQAYDGPMLEVWDVWSEVLTWCLNANPDRRNGARVPIAQFLPYLDARADHRPRGVVETVLFGTTRLTELYTSPAGRGEG